MTIETSLEKLPELSSVQIFMSEIGEPLSKWSEATGKLQEIAELYKDSGGIIDEWVQKGVDFDRRYFLSRGKVLTPIIVRVLTQRFRAAFTQALSSGEVPENLIKISRHEHLAKKLTAEEKRESDELDAEFYTQLNNYKEQVKQPKQTLTDSSVLITDRLTDWLKTDFTHLFELAAIARSETGAVVSLLRFLATDHAEVLGRAADFVRNSELENPNSQRFCEFLDNLGRTYYQQRKKDSLWPTIEFFLPQTSSEIKAWYEHTDNEKARQRLSFESIFGQIQNFGKALPPVIRDRYATYLSDLQKTAISLLSQMISQYKKNTVKEITAPLNFADILQKGKAVHKTEIEDEVVFEKPATETATQKRIVLISGRNCEDETSIKQALEQLFKKTSKNIQPNQIDSYTFILAKLAGLRTNAPNYDLKKLTQFPVLSLSNGKTERVQRLKLPPSSDLTRLLIAFHEEFVIVIDTTTRDDNVYRQLMRRGGFSQINLPS